MYKDEFPARWDFIIGLHELYGDVVRVCTFQHCRTLTGRVSMIELAFQVLTRYQIGMSMLFPRPGF